MSSTRSLYDKDVTLLQAKTSKKTGNYQLFSEKFVHDGKCELENIPVVSSLSDRIDLESALRNQGPNAQKVCSPNSQANCVGNKQAPINPMACDRMLATAQPK